MTKAWIKCAGIRAIKTVAQTVVATIGARVNYQGQNPDGPYSEEKIQEIREDYFSRYEIPVEQEYTWILKALAMFISDATDK